MRMAVVSTTFTGATPNWVAVLWMTCKHCSNDIDWLDDSCADTPNAKRMPITVTTFFIYALSLTTFEPEGKR
jgi:hypothetical protein